jgi:hypothetical protein
MNINEITRMQTGLKQISQDKGVLHIIFYRNNRSANCSIRNVVKTTHNAPT